eukprot:4677750-Alexandrium_andersonii.AAC.1
MLRIRAPLAWVLQSALASAVASPHRLQMSPGWQRVGSVRVWSATELVHAGWFGPVQPSSWFVPVQAV